MSPCLPLTRRLKSPPFPPSATLLDASMYLLRAFPPLPLYLLGPFSAPAGQSPLFCFVPGADLSAGLSPATSPSYRGFKVGRTFFFYAQFPVPLPSFLSAVNSRCFFFFFLTSGLQPKQLCGVLNLRARASRAAPFLFNSDRSNRYG